MQTLAFGPVDPVSGAPDSRYSKYPLLGQVVHLDLDVVKLLPPGSQERVSQVCRGEDHHAPALLLADQALLGHVVDDRVDLSRTKECVEPFVQKGDDVVSAQALLFKVVQNQVLQKRVHHPSTILSDVAVYLQS